MKPLITVVIPTYNNAVQFIKNLEYNLKLLHDCEVIVVNDNPHMSFEKKLESYDVHVINHSKNKGFAGAVNTGIHASHGEYILLLNDDVQLQDNLFLNITSAFIKNPLLFAISFAQIEKNGVVVGKNILFWKNGFIQHSRSNNLKMGNTGWAEGGSAIFDKEKIKLLGFFDEQFSPFYWEDIDISYRAKKYGFTVLFDPKIKVIHHHETTIGKQFSNDTIASVAYQNQLLCIWKNISSPHYIMQHLYYLLKRIVQSIFHGDMIFLKGFISAFIKIPYILRRRLSVSYLIPDHEILEKNIDE